MGTDKDSDRRFNEEEVNRILDQAVRFDRTRESPSASEGLTLAQVAHSASEAGIPEAAVHAAARIVGSEQHVAPVGPNAYRRSTLLEESLGEDASQRLAMALQNLPESGVVTYVPGSVRWTSHTREGRDATIDIRAESESAVVIVTAARERDLVALLSVGGSLGLIGSLAFAAVSDATRCAELMSIVAIGVGAGLTTAVVTYRWLRRRWLARKEALADRTINAVAVEANAP